ncbi:MAG: fatty acid desaturase [Amphiplicatus sp.]
MTAAEIATLRDLKISAIEEREGVCWKTVIFSTVIIIVIAAQTWLAVTGVIPLWAGTLLNAFWMIQGYAPGHDAVHKNVHGRDERFRWLNGVIGRPVFACALHSYAMHEHVHRLHHAYLNDPEKDIDEFVDQAKSLPMALARSLLFYFHTNNHAIRTAKYNPNPRRYLFRIAVELAVPYSILIALCLMGYGKEVLFLWFIPALLAFAGVVMMFGWVPHHVPVSQIPVKQARLIATSRTVHGRLFAWLYNFHNYHLIHHMFPSVCWYRLERVYERGRHVLELEGARIIHF